MAAALGKGQKRKPDLFRTVLDRLSRIETARHPLWLTGLAVSVVCLLVGFYREALGTFFSQEDFSLLYGSRPAWVSWADLFMVSGGPFYRPLTQQVYYYLNQVLWDLDPVGHHVSNLVLHTANTLLVALLALRWWSPLAAAVSAVLYSLHVSHYFEVFWMAGSSQSGYLLFLLLTLFLLSRYLSSGRGGYFWGSVLTSLGAFLSKEDSMTLPLIAMLLVLMEGRRRVAFCAVYWAIGALVVVWRLYLFGSNIPEGGVYSFEFPWHAITKIRLYTDWLFMGRVFGAAFFALAGYCVVRALRSQDTTGLPREFWLAAMAAVSIAPSFLVPSAVQHYLSFASACLAWAAASLLQRVPVPGRVPVTLLVVSAFLWSAVQYRNIRDLSPSIHVPSPRKAALCRLWVDELREAGPPADAACLQVFRGFPAESHWLRFLPLVAWDMRYLPIQMPGDPEPPEPFACRVEWTFDESGVTRVPESGEIR